MKSTMTAISIHLPENLAKNSQKIANRLQISRAEFIRKAIEHEVIRFRIRQEQEEMAHCFVLMRKNKRYLKESDEILNGFSTELPKDDETWWKTK